MRFLVFIFLFASLFSTAQPGGNKKFLTNIAGTSPRPPEFQWAALTPQSPTAYSGSSTIVVTNKSFTNLSTGVLGGDDIQITGNVNITFRGCYFGPSIRNGISIENFAGTAKFENCLWVSNKCGVEFSSSTGNVQIENSQCINPWGMPACKGQFVQFSGVNTSNSYIRDCAMENFRGEGNTEDWISMFGAVGIVSNYIDVSGNYARGGGPSNSGGGFIAGDGDGRYIRIQSNRFYNPGNYITAAAGGDNIVIQNNLGYQADNEIQNIAMYAYLTNASTHCSGITMTNNGMLLQNSNNYYCYCTPTCGDVIGINEAQGDPTNGWLATNSIITLAQLNFPTTIITFVDEDRLWHLRDESQQFSAQWTTGGCYDGDVQYARPVSNAGSNQSIGGTSATLNGSGSTSTQGFNYQWVQVSGPATASIASPFTASTSVTGMSVVGVYEFRLVVTNNQGAADAAWMTVTKS